MIGAKEEMNQQMNRTAVVIRRLATLAAIVVAMVALAAPAAWAKTFTVNSTANPGSGGVGAACAPDPVLAPAPECTLRGAVNAANANTLTDTINFKAGVSGDIELFNTSTQGGFSILNDATGVDLTINGPGAGVLAVDGNNQTRAFGIAPGANATINGLTIKNGKAPESGFTEAGGIGNSGTLTLNRSTVSGNTADLYGGGIFSWNDLSDDTTTISNSTISGNTAGSHGGGIANYDGLTRIKYSTITNNTAPYGEGSGVWSDDDGTSARTEVLSSIISANTNDNDVEVDDDTTNSFLSKGFNLIGGGDATSAFNKTGDQRGIPDPGLGLLINNGGPTQTHAVLKGSRAIDRGGALKGCPASDQRGQRRPQNGDGKGTSRCDIGAFEKKTVR
ncbi:MAG: hypothetical protein H0T57_00860 [Rubrobacter sp.]|nr:hypothetical protein [Rubrobacter sp.]MDQ3639409.1 hypothetical protein [Actinomycetota bacterium]